MEEVRKSMDELKMSDDGNLEVFFFQADDGIRDSVASVGSEMYIRERR